MSAAPHAEKHFLGSEFVRDVVIGMADGLTVPFALAAAISAAVASTHIVVTAGLAEIVAGATAMGLGGDLAARTDQEHFSSEERREYFEVDRLPEQERMELREIFSSYGLQSPELDAVVKALSTDKKRWVDFMMRFELGLERPDPKRAPLSAFTIAASYFIGGLIPRALHDRNRHQARADVFRGVHRRGASGIRRRQGKTYGRQYVQVRPANPAGGRSRRGGGLLPRLNVRVKQK